MIFRHLWDFEKTSTVLETFVFIFYFFSKSLLLPLCPDALDGLTRLFTHLFSNRFSTFKVHFDSVGPLTKDKGYRVKCNQGNTR